MPGLAVTLNGTRLAEVTTEGLNVLGVRVHGDVLGPEFACVDVSGGLYGEGENSKHLIWVNEQGIAPGDEIEVSLLETVEMSHAGKTIEELFPDEKEPMGPRQPLEDMFRELSKRPKIRDHFTFYAVGPANEIISCATSYGDHSFGFSILWNWQHPERARVSLSSNSLESIEKRVGGTDHANFVLHFGQRVKIRVDV